MNGWVGRWAISTGSGERRCEQFTVSKRECAEIDAVTIGFAKPTFYLRFKVSVFIGYAKDILKKKWGANEKNIPRSFSKQERGLFLEEHKGEQGNGFRPRRWCGHGCSFQLRIPRTRSGAFQPIILGILAAQESERALLFHELYARGLSCEDIAEVGRRIYGHHYSKQQVSRLSGACYEEIQEWLARRLSSHYLAVYIVATFCSTRRDGSVSKEAYYTMLGLLPNGSREVLTVVNHPTEGAIAWEMELEALKERGVEQIDLIVSDALSGIENAVCSAFPTALHQLCVVHFKRKVLNTVSTKDKAEVGEELKALFPVEHTDITPLAAYENLRLKG